MRLKEITFVLLRLIAIWLLIDLTIPNLWSTVFYLTNSEIFPNKNEVIFFYSSQAVLYFIISAVLWFRTEKICSFIYNHETEVVIDGNKGIFLELSLSIIGVYLIATNLPSFISNIYSFFADKSLPTKNYSVIIKYLIQTITAIFIGIICINGRLDIIKLIKRLRTTNVNNAL